MIYLSDVIAPSFYGVHQDIKRHGHTDYFFKGGRGSTKSSFVSAEIPMLMIKNPDMNAVVFRKIARTMRDSTFSQYAWAIDKLGLIDKFICRQSPMEMVYKPTGQTIYFLGLDDASKVKSIKARQGYIGITHFEELDQFAGMREIRTVLQSTMRGGELFYNFMSYNPPRSRDNWVNKEVLIPQPDRLVHDSNYLNVPSNWLGQAFFDRAGYLRDLDPKSYDHEYMGVPVGSGGNVFEHVTLREITDHEVAGFDNRYHGIDWGWYPDPTRYIAAQYQANQRRLFIFDEFGGCKLKNEKLAELLKQHHVNAYHDLITCDNSDNKSIEDLKDHSFLARPTEKFAGSRDYSFKWLASLSEIIIDPARCPKAAEEFTAYEFETTKDGEVMSGYPDGNDHSIDATRYAMTPVWRRRGQ